MLMFAILRSMSCSSWLILYIPKLGLLGVFSIILINLLFICSAVPCGLQLKKLTICWSATKPESGCLASFSFMIRLELANTYGRIDRMDDTLVSFAVWES